MGLSSALVGSFKCQVGLSSGTVGSLGSQLMLPHGLVGSQRSQVIVSLSNRLEANVMVLKSSTGCVSKVANP